MHFFFFRCRFFRWNFWTISTLTEGVAVTVLSYVVLCSVTSKYFGFLVNLSMKIFCTHNFRGSFFFKKSTARFNRVYLSAWLRFLVLKKQFILQIERSTSFYTWIFIWNLDFSNLLWFFRFTGYTLYFYWLVTVWIDFKTIRLHYLTLCQLCNENFVYIALLTYYVWILKFGGFTHTK